MKKKIITIVIIVTLLLISFGVNPVSGLKTTNIRTSQTEKYNDETASIIVTGSLSVDLKVRKSGDTGWLDSITAQVGNTLEFKIGISSTEGKIAVTIQFPYIDDNVMLNYVIGSASVTPFLVVSEAIIWLFVDIPPSEITFKAKIKKAGTESVNLIVGSTEDPELEDEDSVQVTGKGGCCFPAGTKITMVDGSCKNIEDIRLGDQVLSYDIEKREFTSWIVKMLGNPVHPVYEINDGLIRVTVDHPFYIKKPDKRTGWGAIDAKRSMDSIIFKEDVLTLEVGDQLFTSDGEWIKVTSITLSSEPVQTYNILSFSGTRTYFANGILVYEEHPPHSYTNHFLENILEKFPRITRVLLLLPIFNKLLTPK